MTTPITIEEYRKDPAKVNATIQSLTSGLRGLDTSGANPTLKDIPLQIQAVRRAESATGSGNDVILVREVNKYIALLDRTLQGPSLSPEQKASITSTLSNVASGKESSKPQGVTTIDNSYKKKPDTITPEKWAANDRAIVDAAKEAIVGLSKSTDPNIRRLVEDVQRGLSKGDKDTLYASLSRLQVEVAKSNDPAMKPVLDKLGAASRPMAENSRSSNGKTMEGPPKAAAPPPKPTPATGKLCEPITHERWGVRFRFLDKPPEKKGECESKGDGQWDMKDWFLQLLPAMQSVIPRQGARDVPNAGPGLSFKFKNNIVKHKIPGGQPVYQMMGVDSAIITFVGTFTGDGGLGYINKVNIENGELAEESLKLLESEATARRAGQAFAPAKKYGGEYPYGKNPVNAMFNPIYHVRNRARAPGGDTSSALVGSNSSGWLMDNSILRQGFFERDGCPGQCPPPSWGGFPNGHMDEAGGKFAWGGFGTWPDGSPYGDIGTRSQMDTHKLAHIAAYLDAYHEMVSFYKFAVQAGKLMEITINLRKTHDGLKPRVADPRMKGKLRSDTPDPLRDMHTGNPTFKGYLRTMSTWAQYSDRVWYVMEFEVVDHGLQGKKAVNLTNKVKAGGASSGGGADGGEGEALGSKGSDSPESGDASAGASNVGSGGNKASSSSTGGLSKARKDLYDSMETTTLPIKDGEPLKLLEDGRIISADGKTVLSYNEALDKLHSYDLIGINTLRNWFNASMMSATADSIGIRNVDGSVIVLSNNNIKQYSKDGALSYLDPKVSEILVSGDINRFNTLQRAVIEEWRGTVAKQSTSVPSTTPAPTLPPSTQRPMLGPPLPPIPLREPIVIPRNTSPPNVPPPALVPPGIR